MKTSSALIAPIQGGVDSGANNKGAHGNTTDKTNNENDNHIDSGDKSA